MDDRESRVRAGKKLWPFLCAGWIYTPPGSNGSQRVNNAFDSSYSEVMWVGRPRDGGKDITCKQVAPTRNVIVQCKRSNSKVDHGFLQGMKDKLKNVSRGTTFTNGIAAVFPGIRNRTEVLNILQEINDELRNNSKFILLEEWEITPLSEHSIQEIQRGAKIGDRSRVQSHSFICDKVTIGEDCFIGHGVTFVNDLFRTGSFSRSDADWKATVIGNNVSIGSGACILPVNICNNVVIGAGSVVTKDITEPGVYLGNPARKNAKSRITLDKDDETMSNDVCASQPLKCSAQKSSVVLQQNCCFSGLLKFFDITATRWSLHFNTTEPHWLL